MAHPPIDIEIGSTVRGWTIIAFDPLKKKGRHYLCKCKCGKVLSKPIGDLIRVGPDQCKSCATKFRNFSAYGKEFTLDLLGKKFGKWTVLERIHNGKRGAYWKCQCDCGSVCEIFGPELNRGGSTQCIKCSKYRHGACIRGSRKSEYNSWVSMKNRCLIPTDISYKNYGCRGIQVYQEWIDSFEKFLEYMGPKPFKGASIDRIDNDGHYQPGNVRWASAKEQSVNRRHKTLKEK